jgi:DNA polymerase III epsilon subunit-like protein
MKHLEIYFSIDIEASGPIPGEYSMLSLGACRVDSPNRHFYAELKPISDRFVPEALKVSRFNLQELGRTGQQPRQAMRSFSDWLTATADKGNPVFVGFNASFDWSFVNWYFHKFLGTNPFGFGALDIKAYYMGLTGCHWEQTKSSELPRLLKAQMSERKRHNALADAINQAGIFQKMMDFRSRLQQRETVSKRRPRARHRRGT